MFRAGIFAAASALLMSAAPALASSLPVFATGAVDGVNSRVEAFVGASDYRIWGTLGDSANVFGVAGLVAAPLGESFGLQVDGLLASRSGAFTGGVAGHLFWRDPATALFGLYAATARRGGFGERNVRLAIEGEAYLGRFTIGGIAGFERTIASSGVLFLPDGELLKLGSENRFFSSFDFSFYAADNLKLFVGHRYSSGVHMGAAGAEYLVQTGAGAAYSFFTEGRLGEQRFAAVLVGVRVYFGQKDKSLIQRNREDHAPTYTPDFILSPGGVRRLYLPYPPRLEWCDG